MKKNIFVIALNDFSRKLFGTVYHAEDYRFHSLLPKKKVVAAPSYSMPDLLAEAQQHLQEFNGPIDAIICYWDFPATIMLPTLPPSSTRPGRWIAERSWPSENIKYKSFTLGWPGLRPGRFG